MNLSNILKVMLSLKKEGEWKGQVTKDSNTTTFITWMTFKPLKRACEICTKSQIIIYNFKKIYGKKLELSCFGGQNPIATKAQKH
ncbi:MAG: hypothetical protein HYU69_10500 [Bacteroidetes bacterium]|nr:hypothetical protein [Bacteroidota bacterium]